MELANRRAPDAPDAELEHGIPLCIDQLSKTLRVEQTPEPMRSREISGPAGGGQPVLSEIGGTAPQHGRKLLQHSFTIDQAVTEYAYRHDVLLAEKGVRALNERLGSLAHELRSLIHTASLALTAIKAGQVGLSGATGAVLDRKPDRTAHSHRSLARRRTPERRDADRESLIPAVGNLLQNAFKFTRARSEVSLNAYAAADRILIEVEDSRGGLPPSNFGKMFEPFHAGKFGPIRTRTRAIDLPAQRRGQ
ncbi:MAG TPA: ATP-binding protein [Steroidobacteraceae bacterium]|nr:ATP-binding protein [Steroidobacteraceae bacterium]